MLRQMLFMLTILITIGSKQYLVQVFQLRYEYSNEGRQLIGKNVTMSYEETETKRLIFKFNTNIGKEEVSDFIKYIEGLRTDKDKLEDTDVFELSFDYKDIEKLKSTKLDRTKAAFYDFTVNTKSLKVYINIVVNYPQLLELAKTTNN